tara:strand:+ start:12183 stop:12500 length:318 start_codon:yes stop_codon:yes gene_type:complete
MYTLFMTVENLKNLVEEKLKFTPSLGVKFKFNLGDDGVILIDGTQTPAVVSEEDIDADTTFICTADTMAALLSGKQDPTMAFMSGKLKVQGSMGNALKLASMLED